MSKKNWILASLLALTLGASPVSAATYKIDPAHSQVSFTVKHLGISSVSGRFDSFEGTFTYDPKNVAASKAEATIDVASVDTSQTKRDGHLKDCDFFCVEKFQKMKFVTKEVKPAGESKFKILGELTLHGVTKPVELDAEFQGSAKHFDGSNRAGFVATGVINRMDFDLKWDKLTEAGGFVVGHEVKVNLEIQGIEQK